MGCEETSGPSLTLCLKMLPLPKCLRRRAGFLPKDATEIPAVGKPHFDGDFGDRFAGGFKQVFGLIDPVPSQVFDGRGAQFLAKTKR